MKPVLKFISREFKEILPAMVFFLVLFNLIAWTKQLMLAEHSVTIASTATATIGALVIAKVILIADALPMSRIFSDRPLAYNVLWRTTVYSLVALLFQYLEELIPHLVDGAGFSLANTEIFERTHLDHFLAVHLWVVTGLLVYSIASGMTEAVGRERTRQIFFGSTAEEPKPGTAS